MLVVGRVRRTLGTKDGKAFIERGDAFVEFFGEPAKGTRDAAHLRLTAADIVTQLPTPRAMTALHSSDAVASARRDSAAPTGVAS